MENAVISKIKAEIDKRYAEYREKMKSDDFTYYEGMAAALDLFEQFIDTLELKKPVPKDLEEAANKFAVFYDQGTCDGIAQDCFIAGAKWKKEKNDKDLSDKIAAAYQLGLADKEKQMMKEAVEGFVNYYEDSGGILMAEAQVGCPYHNGDKVKIIIVKEDLL